MKVSSREIKVAPTPLRSMASVGRLLSSLLFEEDGGRSPVTKWQLAETLYNWCVWSLFVVLVTSQFCGTFWDTTKVHWPAVYGQSPLKGTYAIKGFNDEPYTDRSFVCVLQGSTYAPLTVNEALALGSTKMIDSTGTAVNGYRVVKRDTAILGSEAAVAYTYMCSLIAETIGMIYKTCSVLGYNITQDNLRVVDDLDSQKMFLIGQSLPILVMPFWDNNLGGRMAIPGHDGSACMFRLVGQYLDPAYLTPLSYGVNRMVRESKTIEWLKRPGGVWKNGWYEDTSGMKWYSDVVSSHDNLEFRIGKRQFDMRTGMEIPPEKQKGAATVLIEHWGPKLSSVSTEIAMTSIAIANGNRYGLFLYSGSSLNYIKNIYDWETLLSNTVTSRILYRWLVIMIALHRGYAGTGDEWSNAGIGCLANFSTFNYLPLLLLPRLKMILFAFCAIGCQFEGQQRSLSDAWFVIYPAIVELMLLYYSLINLLAKLLSRRVSDALFGPTVLFLCVFHCLRLQLAVSGLFEFDSRISTLISDDEVDKLTLLDFFTTDLALRANGNIKSLFFIKIGVLGLNLLPLVFSLFAPQSLRVAQQPSRVESALAIQLAHAGGLGRSRTFGQKQSLTQVVTTNQVNAPRVLSSYEIIRLGYIVYGNNDKGSSCYLISVDDWDLLTLLAPLRKIAHLWNHRVKLFDLAVKGKTAVIVLEPQMCHVDDRRLLHIRWWQIRAQAIK